jgi:hypothetical protein
MQKKISFLLLLSLWATCMVSPALARYSFNEKSRTILKAAAREHKKDFFTVLAKIKTGRPAWRDLDSLLFDEKIGGSFLSYSAIATYLYLQNELPDSLAKKFRDVYHRRAIYRGDTENHWAMYYTGMLLASQTWPNEPATFWFNGKTSQENWQEAHDYLLSWIKIATTSGQGEFDSPTYFITYVTPMLVLYDFCQDPMIRHRAELMLHLLFADFAVDHLHGVYGGGHSRDYPEDIVNPLISASTMWAWLYFGEPEFEPWTERRGPLRHRGWETVCASLSHYRLPELIRHMATDRRKPYVNLETKRTRNIIRFREEMNPIVYKYTYMSPSYVLGSLYGGILQPIQQHTWDVSYVSDKPNNTLFTLHPFYSGKELAMFFPEDEKILTDEVNRYHLIYKDPNKWNSSSPYEQTFQHRNALIVVYEIDSEAQHPHIDGFFPKTLLERRLDPSGWIFCNAGKTYIAFFPLKPYEWIEEKINWRWRSHELRNGIVLQVDEASHYTSFQDFCGRFKAVPQFQFGRVTYKTLDGEEMQFSFNGAHLLNGQLVRFWPDSLYESPYMHSKRYSGMVELRYGDEKMVLDFN